jgi:hypothetical protein
MKISQPVLFLVWSFSALSLPSLADNHRASTSGGAGSSSGGHGELQISFAEINRAYDPDATSNWGFVDLPRAGGDGSCYANPKYVRPADTQDKDITPESRYHRVFSQDRFRIRYKRPEGLGTTPTVAFLSNDTSRDTEYEDDTLGQEHVDHREANYSSSGSMGGLSRTLQIRSPSGKIIDGAEHTYLEKVTINHFTKVRKFGGKDYYVLAAIGSGEPFRSSPSDIGGTLYYCLFPK